MTDHFSLSQFGGSCWLSLAFSYQSWSWVLFFYSISKVPYILFCTLDMCLNIMVGWVIKVWKGNELTFAFIISQIEWGPADIRSTYLNTYQIKNVCVYDIISVALILFKCNKYLRQWIIPSWNKNWEICVSQTFDRYHRVAQL